MRKIPLTREKVALVDDQDYDWLNQWKWCALRHRSSTGIRWYAVRGYSENGKNCFVYMHREIAAKAGLPDIGHRDHDGLNNQRFNLRPCTRSQNNANQRKSPGRNSRFKGVSWDSIRSNWKVQIKINSHNRCLGRFTDEVEAAKTYATAAKEAWGEFAYA